MANASQPVPWGFAASSFPHLYSAPIKLNVKPAAKICPKKPVDVFARFRRKL